MSSLSPQEARILDLIADGMTNRQIAEAMFLSENTVKNYVTGLLRKLKVTESHRSGHLRHQAQESGLGVFLCIVSPAPASLEVDAPCGSSSSSRRSRSIFGWTKFVGATSMPCWAARQTRARS